LISLPLGSLPTFSLLFVVTFNCCKQEAELMHILFCTVDHIAFGLGKGKKKKNSGNCGTKTLLLAATPVFFCE